MTSATWSHSHSRRYLRVVIGVAKTVARSSSVTATATSDPYGCPPPCVHSRVRLPPYQLRNLVA